LEDGYTSTMVVRCCAKCLCWNL